MSGFSGKRHFNLVERRLGASFSAVRPEPVEGLSTVVNVLGRPLTVSRGLPGSSDSTQ